MKHFCDRSVSQRLGRLCAGLVVVLFAAATTSQSRAGVIYDTTASSTLTDVDVSTAATNLKQATLFHTTASDFIVTEMSFLLRIDVEDPPTGSLNWLIYSDVGGQPDLPVLAYVPFSLNVSTLSGTYAAVSTGALNIPLSPSTNYWLVFNGESLTSGVVQIEEALNPSGIGSPFKAMTYNTNAWTGVNNLAAVGTITAVPEPSTYAMALGGLACGGFSFFRRRKRA